MALKSLHWFTLLFSEIYTGVRFVTFEKTLRDLHLFVKEKWTE